MDSDSGSNTAAKFLVVPFASHCSARFEESLCEVACKFIGEYASARVWRPDSGFHNVGFRSARESFDIPGKGRYTGFFSDFNKSRDGHGCKQTDDGDCDQHFDQGESAFCFRVHSHGLPWLAHKIGLSVGLTYDGRPIRSVLSTDKN